MDEMQMQGESPEPIFDRQTLRDRVDGDDDLLGAVLEVFLDDAPQTLHAIERALERMDRTELRSQAHSLKGAAANISALALCSAAGRLEQMVQAAPEADVVAGVATIRTALAALQPVLVRALQMAGVSPC